MSSRFDKSQVKKLEKTANQILALEDEVSKLTNTELSDKTFEFKQRIENGESLDSLLVEAFAIAREASFRVLGKKHYKVQLMGGICIHQGRVAEMKTGEGKTLTELCPVYLNSLTGKGVHVVTVNDYLAARDKEEMEPFFEFLNLSTGLVIDGNGGKKAEYAKDVTYTTNTELGFDYLRDNVTFSLDEKVQRGLNFAIIDEVDSILIDEARTPLIISGPGGEPTDIYERICSLVRNFTEDDYEMIRKEDIIFITEEGVAKVEKILGIENLADLEHTEINHIISQTLRAHYLLKLNRDYIVRNGEIILIDANTGRAAEGRRFSDGLHQCLEAKEGVTIQAESKTLATITYQNFFQLYNKVAGMSGTVKTEEDEFREIYNLDVVCIPTNKEIQRVDADDKVFINNEAKINAIVEDIIKTHEKGNPILVGTPSIVKSEEISELLTEKGIEHKLLNAKTNEAEAEIIAKAGEFNSITVATNIAGRGTDIKVSDEVNQAGGLRVIGTERSESRRIDNQLIGRAGRQGDNGSSQFYLSCDDKLLKVYGEGVLKEKFEKAYKRNKQVSNTSIVKSIEKAQRAVNGIYYEARKYTLKYDFILNKHRDLVYADRDKVLGAENIAQNISDMILEEVFYIVAKKYVKYADLSEDIHTIREHINDYEIFDINNDEIEVFYYEITEDIKERFKNKISFSNDEINHFNELKEIAKIIDYITNKIIGYINELLKQNIVVNDTSIRNAMLFAVDSCWVVHLDEMDLLKKVVKDQSYNQKDPVDVYKLESGKKFEKLGRKIRIKFIDNLFSSIYDVDVNYDENGEIESFSYTV